MASPQEIRVALNGYLFFEVFNSLRPELYKLLTAKRRQPGLVLTDKMLGEYRRIASGMGGYPMEEFGALVRTAKSNCRIVRRAGPEPNIPGLPDRHRHIVLQACAARATHLVVSEQGWKLWGGLTNDLSEGHGVTVLTSQALVGQVM